MSGQRNTRPKRRRTAVPRFGDGDESGGSQLSDGVPDRIPSPHQGGATTQPMSEPPPPGDTERSHWYQMATLDLQRTLARLNAKVTTDPEGISSADLETLQRDFATMMNAHPVFGSASFGTARRSTLPPAPVPVAQQSQQAEGTAQPQLQEQHVSSMPPLHLAAPQNWTVKPPPPPPPFEKAGSLLGTSQAQQAAPPAVANIQSQPPGFAAYSASREAQQQARGGGWTGAIPPPARLARVTSGPPPPQWSPPYEPAFVHPQPWNVPEYQRFQQQQQQGAGPGNEPWMQGHLAPHMQQVNTFGGSPAPAPVQHQLVPLHAQHAQQQQQQQPADLQANVHELLTLLSALDSQSDPDVRQAASLLMENMAADLAGPASASGGMPWQPQMMLGPSGPIPAHQFSHPPQHQQQQPQQQQHLGVSGDEVDAQAVQALLASLIQVPHQPPATGR